MIKSGQISFGDNVRIRSTPETAIIGVNDRVGQVYGLTTPSITEVEVIGHSVQDIAINVYFEERSEAFWFAPELVEFVDHASGTTIEIDQSKAVRKPDGSWQTNKSLGAFFSRLLGRFQ
jgi:hypothetical protein